MIYADFESILVPEDIVELLRRTNIKSILLIVMVIN